MYLGVGFSSVYFSFSRASGESAPPDFKLESALATELQFQYFVTPKVGLFATAGLLNSRLRDKTFYDPLRHTRHEVEVPGVRNIYLLAGAGINLSKPKRSPRIVLLAKAGYVHRQSWKATEKYISLQTFFTQEDRYAFEQSEGWMLQPGVLIAVPISPRLFLQSQVMAHFGNTRQAFTKIDQASTIESGRFRAYYDGLALQLALLYQINRL